MAVVQNVQLNRPRLHGPRISAWSLNGAGLKCMVWPLLGQGQVEAYSPARWDGGNGKHMDLTLKDRRTD
jgi:hypothetical protein